jgi:hypothetical protein
MFSTMPLPFSWIAPVVSENVSLILPSIPFPCSCAWADVSPTFCLAFSANCCACSLARCPPSRPAWATSSAPKLTAECVTKLHAFTLRKIFYSSPLSGRQKTICHVRCPSLYKISSTLLLSAIGKMKQETLMTDWSDIYIRQLLNSVIINESKNSKM